MTPSVGARNTSRLDPRISRSFAPRGSPSSSLSASMTWLCGTTSFRQRPQRGAAALRDGDQLLDLADLLEDGGAVRDCGSFGSICAEQVALLTACPMRGKPSSGAIDPAAVDALHQAGAVRVGDDAADQADGRCADRFPAGQRCAPRAAAGSAWRRRPCRPAAVGRVGEGLRPRWAGLCRVLFRLWPNQMAASRTLAPVNHRRRHRGDLQTASPRIAEQYAETESRECEACAPFRRPAMFMLCGYAAACGRVINLDQQVIALAGGDREMISTDPVSFRSGRSAV